MEENRQGIYSCQKGFIWEENTIRFSQDLFEQQNMYDEQNHSFQNFFLYLFGILWSSWNLHEDIWSITIPFVVSVQRPSVQRQGFQLICCKNQSTKTHSNVFCSLKIRSKHEEFLWQLSTWRIWHPQVCIMEIQTKWFSSVFQIWHFKEQCYEQVAFKSGYCQDFLSAQNFSMIDTSIGLWMIYTSTSLWIIWIGTGLGTIQTDTGL